jgi:hypothetical protein
MTEIPQRVVVSVDEALYYSLWYEPPGRARQTTPRVSPPVEKGERPETVPFRSIIRGEPIFIQRVDRRIKAYPSISSRPEKILSPIGSDTLGPNCYVMVGEVVACDKYAIMLREQDGVRRRKDEWRLEYVIDCGIPVGFWRDFHPVRPEIGGFSNSVEVGAYFEGLVKLSCSSWSTTTGLHQAVSGIVQGMRVLELDPGRDDFGRIAEVPFGHRLSIDPDFVSLPEVSFMDLDVAEIGPLSYGAFPARDPECPEPNYPGLVKLPQDTRVKIVRLSNRGEDGEGQEG